MTDLPCDNPLWTPGVDVSSAQRALTPAEWAAVRASGARFAYAKIAESDYPMDPRAIDHARGARAAGLLFDGYGFIHSDRDGRLQAEAWAPKIEAVMRAIGTAALDLRFMIDCEDQARIAASPSRALDCWLSCADRLWQLTGEMPLIYTGPGPMALLRGLPAASIAALATYDVEIAHYRFDPASGRDYGLRAPTVPMPWSSRPERVRAWQWSGDRGPRIAGVPFDIDRDVYFGTEEELRAWGLGEVASSASPPSPSTLPAPPDPADPDPGPTGPAFPGAASGLRAGEGEHEPAAPDDDDLDVTKP